MSSFQISLTAARVNAEMTQKDVAELLGISQSYISRIEKKVIRRLKNLVKC